MTVFHAVTEPKINLFYLFKCVVEFFAVIVNLSFFTFKLFLDLLQLTFQLFLAEIQKENYHVTLSNKLQKRNKPGRLLTWCAISDCTWRFNTPKRDLVTTVIERKNVIT